MKKRLDIVMVERGLAASRSAGENLIRLGAVTVDGKITTKPGYYVDENTTIKLIQDATYVSRAGLKLASVAEQLGVSFRGKIVLDVGSSTGGFTDYALQHGAAKVIAVDVGTDQLHPTLRSDERIELHEKTDIRNVVSEGRTKQDEGSGGKPHVTVTAPDIVVIDVSFISLREILPHIASCVLLPSSICVAMVKPQFEAGRDQVSKGVIKNDRVRRGILHDFESWARQRFVILNKADSAIPGARGNRERFYLLRVPNEAKNTP